MQEEVKPVVTDAGYRVFKLITNEIIFGETQTIKETDGSLQFLVKEPYTAENGGILPYMARTMGNGPGAVQLHPMNVIWTVPLDEFKTVEQAYNKATSNIITPEKPNIIV